jgi:RNA polymerase sigma-70 factor, ECF subfamily
MKAYARRFTRLVPTPRPRLDRLPDAELIDMARRGNEKAFGELYERYLPRIYNYTYYRTSNRFDAEDLTSRVFQRALAHIGRYEDQGLPFQAWLYRIAHNLVANHHRDTGRRKIIALDEYLGLAATGESPSEAMESQEQRTALLRAIENLPEERQQLLMLKFVAQKSNAEIGLIMDRTEGAIKSLYHRTLMALRRELESQTNEPSQVSVE